MVFLFLFPNEIVDTYLFFIFSCACCFVLGLPQTVRRELFKPVQEMTSKKPLVAYPKKHLATNNEAEDDFHETVACAVQTITTEEDGFLSQDQRYMLACA